MLFSSSATSHEGHTTYYIMQKIYTLALLFIVLNTLNAQLHDNVWYLGYDSNPDELEFGGTTIEFREDSLNIYYEFREMNFFLSNASFSDSSGHLLLVTNNHFITNQNNILIPNGEGLNPGFYETPGDVLGYPLSQGCLFLSSPTNPDEVYLFHLTVEPPQNNLNYYSKDFYYSKIVNVANSPEVIEKNKLIYSDTLNLGRLTAVKHADGRSWWLVLKDYQKECFFCYLWKEDELNFIEKQCFSQEQEMPSIGQVVFSPDGTRYIYQSIYDNIEDGTSIQIYDFDRCTGALSNRQSFGYIDGAWGGGVAVSPNSRFLYVSSYYYLYQYDLWADDIEATKDTIAEWDGWADPVFTFLESTFNSLQLGPDGKIYMCTRGATNVMHRINNPDMQGDSCNFVQRDIQLPTFNAFSIPNFPNYRLGPTESICDTVTLSTSPVDVAGSKDVKVYPNPAQGQVFVWLAAKYDKALVWRLRDVSGHLMREKSMYLPQGGSSSAISLEGLAGGLYFWELLADDGAVLGVGKIVVTNF